MLLNVKMQCLYFITTPSNGYPFVVCDLLLVLLGEFNTSVGQSYYTCPKALGKFGTAKAKTNGNLLLSIYTEHQLIIASTYFKHNQIHKNSWKHAKSKYWQLIDYIIMRQRHLNGRQNTRAMKGANCSIDNVTIKSTTSELKNEER